MMTPEQAAAYLQVSINTVKRMLQNGSMPGKKIGAKLWRIRKAELDRWIDEQAGPRP